MLQKEKQYYNYCSSPGVSSPAPQGEGTSLATWGVSWMTVQHINMVLKRFLKNCPSNGKLRSKLTCTLFWICTQVKKTCRRVNFGLANWPCSEAAARAPQCWGIGLGDSESSRLSLGPRHDQQRSFRPGSRPLGRWRTQGTGCPIGHVFTIFFLQNWHQN